MWGFSIKILGAGPGGSSAAYNIHNFAHQRGILVDITVYEKSDYVGGRTTCKIKVDDQIVQIAAKGFHTSNKNLVDAIRGLDLAPVMLDGKDDTSLAGRSGDLWGVYVLCFPSYLGESVSNVSLQLFSADMMARHSSTVKPTTQIFCRSGGGTPD